MDKVTHIETVCCDHVLYRLIVAIPCENCSAVAFCNVICRSKAQNTFHKFECRFLDLLIGSGMSILCFAALRILSQQNLKYFLDAEEHAKTQSSEHAFTKVYFRIFSTFLEYFNESL